MKNNKIKSVLEKTETKVHSWRMCPLGEHWVNSYTKNKGKTIVRGFCRTNPSKKDQIYSEELRLIAENYFSNLLNIPAAIKLDAPNGNDYDMLIAGWVKYWNDVFNPDIPLEPNIIKALIRTESTFNEKAKALASPKNWARGLTQVTDETLKILSHEKGELKDHLLNINQKEVYNPNLNIAAGVRWLFHKKYLLEKKKRRKVSWEEAVMEYKSYTKKIQSKDANAIEKQAEYLKHLETLRKHK